MRKRTQNPCYIITLKDSPREEKGTDYQVNKETYFHFFKEFEKVWDRTVQFTTTEGKRASGIFFGLKRT